MPVYRCTECETVYQFDCKPGLPGHCTYSKLGSCMKCNKPIKCENCGAKGDEIVRC